jgi:hypothetical protein
MTNKEKADFIYSSLHNKLNIDKSLKSYYYNQILRALGKIDEKEKEELYDLFVWRYDDEVTLV